MHLFNETIELEGGHKVIVTVKKSKCGRGIVVGQVLLSPDGRTKRVNCSGSCGGGPMISWTCPEGQDCFLDCTGGSAEGKCYTAT